MSGTELMDAAITCSTEAVALTKCFEEMIHIRFN